MGRKDKTLQSFLPIALIILVSCIASPVDAQGQGQGRGQGLVIPPIITSTSSEPNDTPADFSDEPGDNNGKKGLRGPPWATETSGEDEFERLLIKFNPKNAGQARAAIQAEARIITADLSDRRGIMGAVVRRGRGAKTRLQAMPFIDTVEDDFIMHTLGWEDDDRESKKTLRVDEDDELERFEKMLAGTDDKDNSIVGLGDEAFSIHKRKKKAGQGVMNELRTVTVHRPSPKEASTRTDEDERQHRRRLVEEIPYGEFCSPGSCYTMLHVCRALLYLHTFLSYHYICLRRPHLSIDLHNPQALVWLRRLQHPSRMIPPMDFFHIPTILSRYV